MTINAELTKLNNEITNFEKNVNKLTIIILVVENYKLVTLFKNSINILNNIILRKELIEHLKSIELLKDYKIQYILKFIITKSLEELNSSINLEDSYKMIPSTVLNSSDNIIKTDNKNYETKLENTFTRINSLIIVVNKKQ